MRLTCVLWCGFVPGILPDRGFVSCRRQRTVGLRVFRENKRSKGFVVNNNDSESVLNNDLFVTTRTKI